jgi:pyruvate kinase
MIHNNRPTRAEVSDVATAVTNGADAVMLSGETAIGKYPVQAVKIMDRTLEQAEKLMKMPERIIDPDSEHILADSVSFSAVELSRNLNAIAIVLYSESGFTARTIAHFAPSVPIYVFTTDVHTARICNLYRGTETFLLQNKPDNFDDFLANITKTLLMKDLADTGDTIVAANVTGSNRDYSHSNSIKVFNC